MLSLAETYVEQDAASYRGTVQGGPAGRQGYQTADGAHLPGDDALHHSTLWRTVSWLGSLEASLRSAIDLILHRDPASQIHRFGGAVAARKFRSSRREQQLRTTRCLLHAMSVFEQIFDAPFFPRFATAAGGG